MPARFNRSHLPQRHPNTGDGRRYLDGSEFFGIEGIDTGGIKDYRYAVGAFVQGRECGTLRGFPQIKREHRLSDTESCRLIGFEHQSCRRSHIEIIATNALHLRLHHHIAVDTVCYRKHQIPVIAFHTYLQRVLDSLVIQLFEACVGIRKIILVFGRIFLKHLCGGFTRWRIHNQLRIIRCRCLRGISGMETRTGLADKRRHARHPFIGS